MLGRGGEMKGVEYGKMLIWAVETVTQRHGEFDPMGENKDFAHQ